MQIARELRSQLDQEFASVGLTSQQAGLVLHVYAGHTGPRALAELLGTDAAATSRMVERLVAKGLLSRTPSPRDRRAVEVRLTQEGEALVPSLPRRFDVVGRRLAAGYEPDELNATLEDLLSNLEPRDG